MAAKKETMAQRQFRELEASKKPVVKTRKVARSAADGEFVSKAEAKANPKGTVIETVKVKPKGRKAVRAKEPTFQLITGGPGGVGCEDASTWMTMGEMLAFVADKVMEDKDAKDLQGKSTPFRMPATLPAVADLLYTTRQERLKYTHLADAMKVHETAMKDHLINNLPKNDSTGAAGKLAYAKIETEDTPVIGDFDKLKAYIKKTGSFELLNRAINRKSIKERWQNGKDVPGIEHFTAVKVSVTKVGGGK